MPEIIDIIHTYIVSNWELLITVFGVFVEMIITVVIVIRALLNGKLQTGIKAICMEVEQLEGLTSAQKLQYALDKAKLLCRKLGIRFNKDKIVKIIEDLITFSKTVNVPKSSKVKVK